MASGAAALSETTRKTLELLPLQRHRLAGSPGYSRFVQAMKLLLPLTAAGLLLAVLAWPGASPPPGEFRLSYALGGQADGPPTMERPRYVGVDGGQRQHVITALRAVQSAANQGNILLTEPQADLTDGDGTWLAVTAASGLYQQTEGRLWLEGPVSVYSDLGYEFAARSLDVDLKAGTAETAEPVAGQGPLGVLRAERARITDKGARLWFEGKVRVVLHGGGNRSATAGAQAKR
jgi:lipopolysaccharide export system protein LptC